MEYTPKGPFTDVPYPDNPPPGAKPLKASYFNDVEEFLAEQGSLNATFATNSYVQEIAYGSNLEATDSTVATWIGDEATATGAKAAQTFLSPAEAAGTFAYESAVDARKHGLEVGTALDMSAQLNVAADLARVEDLPLFIPAGQIHIDATVDFRYLTVFSEAQIIVRHVDAPGVVVGDYATQRNARRIEMVSVKHDGAAYADWDFAFPAVRVVGLKGATVRIGNCTLLELWADGADSLSNSVAYNTLELGRIQHMRLHGINGMGWVTENLTLGGSYNRVTLSGSYEHNHNKWVKPSVEGSASMIDIQTGSQNTFEDCRPEGGTQVKFGASTRQNHVIGSYTSNASALSAFNLIEDLGSQNSVTSRELIQTPSHTLLKIDNTLPLFDTACAVLDSKVNMPIPSVGMGKLAIRQAYAYFMDTGLIKIEENQGTPATQTLSPPSRVTRFNLYSDANILRPKLYAYDAAGLMIDARVNPFNPVYAGWQLGTDGSYDTAGPGNGYVITITNPDVKYIRLMLNSSVSNQPLFEHITFSAYVQSEQNVNIIESIRRKITRGMFGGKPAQGLAWPGTVVHGNATSYKAVDRRETSLTAAASGTSLTVADGAGIAVGDVIGVLQDSGHTHWTTVATVSGTAVTLAAALVSPAAAGSAVGTTRWVGFA